MDVWKHLLRGVVLVLPAIFFALTPLLLLSKKIRHRIAASELIFYGFVGWGLGYFVAMSKGQVFAEAFAATLAVISFFGMGLLRRHAVAERAGDDTAQYESVYCLMSIGICGLIVSSEFYAVSSVFSQVSKSE